MKKSQIFWVGYLIIGVISAIYGSIWGEMHYRSLSYNLGRGLVWPVIVFPVLEKLLAQLLSSALSWPLLHSRKSERGANMNSSGKWMFATTQRWRFLCSPDADEAK